MSQGAYPNLALEEQLCFALCRASRAITRVYAKGLDELGLTYSQYLVLMALWAEDDVTASTIAERICLDPATLTPILKRLEAAGLLTRRRPEENQRTVRVSLTEAGWALRPQVARVQREVARATGLSSEDVHRMRRELHELADTLLEAEVHAAEPA